MWSSKHCYCKVQNIAIVRFWTSMLKRLERLIKNTTVVWFRRLLLRGSTSIIQGLKHLFCKVQTHYFFVQNLTKPFNSAILNLIQRDSKKYFYLIHWNGNWLLKNRPNDSLTASRSCQTSFITEETCFVLGKQTIKQKLFFVSLISPNGLENSSGILKQVFNHWVWFDGNVEQNPENCNSILFSRSFCDCFKALLMVHHVKFKGVSNGKTSWNIHCQ